MTLETSFKIVIFLYVYNRGHGTFPTFEKTCLTIEMFRLAPRHSPERHSAEWHLANRIKSEVCLDSDSIKLHYVNIMLSCYNDSCSAKCHFAKCHPAKCHSAKCHSAKCHSAKCHSAK